MEGEVETGDDRGSVFDAAYYRTECGEIPYGRNNHWLDFFGVVADEIARTLNPPRVFDAGCALGFLVESLRDRGISAWGADVSSYAISHVRPDMRPYCRVGSVTEPIDGRYDLITCIEVLEHIPAAEARIAIQNMCLATDTILFSSTPIDLTEATHKNVQLPLWWLRLFAEFQFSPDLACEPSFVSPHAFLVRRQREPLPDEVLVLLSEKLRNKAEMVERELRLVRLSDEKEDLRLEIQKLREVPSIFHIQELQREMSGIYSSPGWHLIAQYRNWLHSSRTRKNWIWKHYEPAAALLLRALGLSAPSQVSDRTSPALLAVSESERSDDSYREWYERSEPSPAGLEIQRTMSAKFMYRPTVSVLVPVYKVPLAIIRAAVESVKQQTYDNWELCLVHADAEDSLVREYLAKLPLKDSRIKVTLLSGNRGISANSNEAMAIATGEFLALLDHDDTLAPFALFEVAKVLNDRPNLDFIYSDKDQIEASGTRRLNPLFKPDWSPELMLSANYLTHLNVMRTERVRSAGGWRSKTDGAQDWDLFFRVIAGSDRIYHIPRVLYHWRRLETSVAARGLDAKPYAAMAQLEAVRTHLPEAGWNSDIDFTTHQYLRLRWDSRHTKPASIVIVSRGTDEEAISFAKRVMDITTYPSFEIVVPLKAPANKGGPGIRLVPVIARHSFGEQLNAAVEQCQGDVIVFLDDSVEIADGDWLAELTGPLANREIGITGAKLIDPRTQKIVHAGIVFTREGSLEYIFSGEGENISGGFGRAFWYRNWLAVSGACFSIRRDVWEQVGGFSRTPEFPRLDVDLCLKVRFHARRRILYNPFARLFQLRTALCEEWLNEGGASYIMSCFPEGDPYFNSNLNCRDGKIQFTRPPASVRIYNDYAAEARGLVQDFDILQAPIDKSRLDRGITDGLRIATITWFLPEFTNPFYGGVCTILRFADIFRRNYGVNSNFTILGKTRPETVQDRIALAFEDLAADSTITVIQAADQLDDVPAADAAIATLWKTAYCVLPFKKAPKKFYFIQDWEPLFYPAGTTAALADATYGFGFPGICNTIELRDRYIERGGKGEFFDPCVDSTIFHAKQRGRLDRKNPYVLFFYGRPGHPRNCFELLAAAMRIVKRKLGEKVLIVAAGADWNPASFGLAGVVENLGVLGYRATGALYRSCDIGVSMMMTCHPSYLPLELMACGAVVVTNRNPHTTWLLKDGVNCLMADNNPSTIADTIVEGLRNRNLRDMIAQNALSLVQRQHSDWVKQADKIYKYMCEQG